MSEFKKIKVPHGGSFPADGKPTAELNHVFTYRHFVLSIDGVRAHLKYKGDVGTFDWGKYTISTQANTSGITIFLPLELQQSCSWADVPVSDKIAVAPKKVRQAAERMIQFQPERKSKPIRRKKGAATPKPARV